MSKLFFPQEYLLHFKENWCRTAGKDLLFGYVDVFQTDLKNPCCIWQNPEI